MSKGMMSEEVMSDREKRETGIRCSLQAPYRGGIPVAPVVSPGRNLCQFQIWHCQVGLSKPFPLRVEPGPEAVRAALPGQRRGQSDALLSTCPSA